MVNILDQSIAIFAKKHAVVVNQKETIGYTFQFMVKFNIQHITIIDDKYKLVGLLTANDILRTMMESNSAKFLQFKNFEIMSKNPSYVKEHQSLKNTIVSMDRLGLSAMPVLTDGSYDGIFTDKDILHFDQIWRDIPDASITSSRGIGRKIQDQEIMPQDFTLWDAAQHIIDNNFKFLLINDGNDKFSGLVSINKTLGSIIPLLMFGRSDMSFLKKMKINSLVRETILTRQSPALIMPTRNLMKSKGVEAVLLFEDEQPVKVITQKDIVGHLIDYI